MNFKTSLVGIKHIVYLSTKKTTLKYKKKLKRRFLVDIPISVGEKLSSLDNRH